MICTAALIAGAVGVAEPQDSFRIDWWDSKIGFHFVEEAAPGGVKLADGFSFGFVQGAIDLPDDGRWLVSIPVTIEGEPAAPVQHVGIRINGQEIGGVEGAAGSGTTLEAIVTGPVLYYNFEFQKPQEAGDSIVVMAGTAEAVCPGDFNLDGALDVLDFVDFAGAFAGAQIDADTDASGSLDVMDFVRFQAEFVAGCE